MLYSRVDYNSITNSSNFDGSNLFRPRTNHDSGGKGRAPIPRMTSKVANEWGFWHMGKFAADYKKLFGFLPSQTQQFSQSVPQFREPQKFPVFRNKTVYPGS